MSKQGDRERQAIDTNMRSEGVRPVGMHLNLDDVEARLEVATLEWLVGSNPRPQSVQVSLADIGPLVARVRELEDAITTIRREQGKVCNEFELCKHVACQSSVASWFIADAALNPEMYSERNST